MRVHQVLVARELGGAGVVALRLSESLVEMGHTSCVWVPDAGPAMLEAQRRGLAVNYYDADRAFSRGVVAAAVENWRFGRKLAREGPGIVHVHAPVYYGALRQGLRFSGLKRVAHVHLEEDKASLAWAFRSPPDLIITCARFLVDYVRATLPGHRQHRQRIVAVQNAVDTERFTPTDDRASAKLKVGARGDRPLVLMLANLAPHKGQETAILATALLKQRGVDVACWLAGAERGGAGIYTQRLEALARESGVADRVQLLGQRGDCPELLRAADFLVLPSTCEGLPLSILEAQATKVPVLASPTAGVPEVVTDGETGFLIAADDPMGYASRIESLLYDRELRGRVVHAAYLRTTQQHNWSTYSRRIVEQYQSLIDGGYQPAASFQAGSSTTAELSA
jgi:glycosyltransferase involved in cell wall biosynthesis